MVYMRIHAFFNCQGPNPRRAKAVQFIQYSPAAWDPQVVRQHAVQTLCRPTWDMDISTEGKYQLIRMDTICPLNELKASYLFSLNINPPWVEQNWAICQTPVHHASLILSLFSVVYICVFISIFNITEHTGTLGQDAELRWECLWWELAFWD